MYEAASARGTVVDESAPEVPAQRDPETGEQQALFDLPEPQEPADRVAEDVDLSEEPDTPVPPPRLGARECAVLDFERRPWKRAGAKEEAIRTEFGISPTNYFQILNALLDDPAALAYNPTLVGRLRRRREARQHSRH